jgi:hypothetical protein
LFFPPPVDEPLSLEVAPVATTITNFFKNYQTLRCDFETRVKHQQELNDRENQHKAQLHWS